MLNWQNHIKLRIFIRTICSVLIVTFSFSNIQYVQAQDFNINQLPVPGTMVGISSPFAPLALKGLIVNLSKPLEFQFIVDTGRGPQDTTSVKDQANQLVKYFLAGITIPERDLWVNLSPYEKNRIVPSALGQTDLGRDLLAQDYILKQLTASLIYPEKDLGKEFWSRVYAKAQKQFGTTNVPVNTFNKVWILPNEAQVFEKNNAVYITKSTLKVMLDEDYVAKQKHQATQASSISSQIIRQIILPEIEKEVNTGKNFAPLRQIYQALILAKWYKETIQNGLIDALYTNKKKVAGVNVDDPAVKEEIYQRYLKAYKKGVFNYIKEDFTPDGQVVPRKYFSGGITQMGTFPLQRTHDDAMLSNSLESGSGLFLMTVNCDIQNDSLRNSLTIQGNSHPNKSMATEPLRAVLLPASVITPKVQPYTYHVTNSTPLKIISIPQDSTKPIGEVKQQSQEPNATSTVLTQWDSILSRISENLTTLRDHAMLVLWAVVGIVGYFIYQIVKRNFGKKKEARNEIVTVNVNPRVQVAAVNSNRQQAPAMAPQRMAPQATGTQITRPSQASRSYQNPQSGSQLPLDLRHELENQIQQLGNATAQSTKDALIRSFRPTGPGELPLPIPITMLNQDTTDRDKVIHILENMQRMMDGTDEKVLRDFERAIDNARDRVTQQALNRFDNLSDGEIVRLLTNGYIEELQREFHQIFEEQVQHMIRFYTPSYQEQALYVSEEINERYPRLPRYLKWILTNNPDLENDYYVQEWLNMIQHRVNQIPAFPDMITGYSKVALTKSLYLNPELAKRVLFFLARNVPRNGYTTDEEMRREVQQELARSLTDDHFIEGEIIPDETLDFPVALEAPPQMIALPASDLGKTEGQKAKLKALTDDYTQFMVKYREQQEAINKVEGDLRELSESLAEARRQNDRIMIDALQPAVEGLTSKLRKLNERMPRLNQDKARFEEQINTLRSEVGPSGTNLYSINPVALGVVGVFTVMFGIPLWITKAILNKWYNTTAGKTLGMGASIASLVAGYYVYLGSLSPQIEKLITDPANADPWLATFFIIWPVAILSGVWGGKVGKGWSHNRLYWKANAAFKKGNYDEAINLLNQAIKLKAKVTNDYTLLGEAQRKKQRYTDAITAYKEALEIEPNNSTTYNNLGVVYVESGDVQKAIESYKRSIELEPNDPVILSNLGKSLHSDGQLLDAARYLQRSQEIKPEADVTEELNQILRQTGRLSKPKEMQALPYLKTMGEVVPSRGEWVKNAYNDFDEWGGGAFFGGLVAAGAFIYGAYNYQWWQMGTDHVSTVTQWTVWIASALSGITLAMGGLFVVGKIADLFITIKRFFGFPSDFKKLQEVNRKTSDEISDKELQEVAPLYARMSKGYLEQIFRSWVDADQEEKVARLFKFGKWDYDKKNIYGDIGEYKRVSRIAATKFGTSVQDQKAIFDRIDSEKDRLAQNGINNAIGLMKDILPQITENSRTRDEFFYWMTQVVNLPNNILSQGQRYVLPVFNDLREYEQAKADAFRKFGPTANQPANAKVNAKINELMQKLEREGLNNFPAILKKLLADINNASRNTDEFVFWINEVLRFEKQWFSSGSYMTLLQNLISYERAKEDAARKLTRTIDQKNQLNQAVDGLREEVHKKQPQGEVAILKDILPRVTEVSNTLAEFLEYIAVLKSFDKNMWSGTQGILTAFNNHVAYKQAREGATAKFAPDTASRQKFLSDIDALKAKLVAKGFPQASDLLKDILPELTKTCRTKDEFIFWFGELVGLNTSVWQRGAQTVINNFNDLAGYKLAKETAVEKLASTAKEKTDLTASIDALKVSLEAKVPSCAGFMKDVILEILKDINVLADPPHRSNDFLWYLGRVVNFETPTWVGGTTQVLAGYQEVKKYILQKRAYFAKFTTNTDENKRLQTAYENLDKSPNFSRPSFIILLNNALEKASKFATTPREFVYWVGTFSELNSDVLEVFCRDFDTVLAYYRDKGKSREFNHLPAVLNQYNKTYHQTVLITTNLLDILTDPGADINKRIENAANYIVEQRIVKLGAPPNLIGLRDVVSFDQLLENPDIGEGQFRNMLNYTWTESSDDENGYSSSYSTSSTQNIRQIASKMGTEGLYTYWEVQKPPYYQEFLNEGKGLIPGFNRPGEKFRVDYDGKAIALTPEEGKEVQPMLDNVTELKMLIQYLREEWPNLYDNFIEPKRELIKGRPLEEFITKESAPKVAIQLLNKVPGWQFSEQQKAIFIMKLMQIMAFPETAAVRAKISSATDSFERLREITAYWDIVWQYVQKQTYISQKAKYYADLVRSIRQKISMLNDKLMDVGDGVMQFYLTGHTMADFFRGSISGECTSYGGIKFKESIGQVTDPSFFLFKIMEKGKWVGNVYTVAAKTSDGKYALFVDWFKINRKHPLVTNAQWEDRRKRFIKNFFTQLKSYIASQGFDYLIVSTATAESGYGLFNLTQEEAKAEANGHTTVSTKLKKLGGMGHLREGDLPTEYIQNFGDPGSQHDVTGYKIILDKSTPQILQQKQRDLEYLEKLLGEMATEETRLARLTKERVEELRQINQKGQEAATNGRNAVALALKAASEQKSVEIQKIEYELNELHIRMHEKRDEYEHLAGDLGLSAPKRRSMASRVASVLIPFVITSTLLLTQKAQAQGYYSSGYSNSSMDFLTPMFWIAGIAGFVGLVYYLLNKAFPPNQYDRGSYYERTYYPPYRYEDLSLPDELKVQQGQVLDQVSADNRGLVPDRLDVRIPFQIGIPRSQGIKALTQLYSTILKYKSILNFFNSKDFYTKFKQRTHELGLADDFDQPQNKSYSFTIGKEEIRYEEDRRAGDFIEQYLKKLVEPKDMDQPAVQARMKRQRGALLSRGWFKPDTQSVLFAYYQLMLANTAFESRTKVDAINRLLKEKNPLGALSVLEEIYRIDIGGEQIALEGNADLRGALYKILQRELDDIRRQFNRSSDFQVNKKEIIRDAKDIQFELRLSDRTADDILRGVASGDCTSINGGSAYYNTIPQFMFDPGLQVFRVLQEGKWVGNVYTIVAERNGKPVLIVDAVQLPVWGRSWPVSVKELADKVLEKIVEYAKDQGFDDVLMSSFVSNFNAIHDHFEAKYQTTPQEIEKVGGFDHLISLGLWDNHAARNEYLETYSPHWNYSIKRIDPNNPKQTLMLRSIWQSDVARLDNELEGGNSSIPDMAMNSTQVKKPASNFRNALKKIAIGLMVAMPLLFATAGSAKAATFTQNSTGTLQVMVETNDTFGQILLDAGYRGTLWGTNGFVANLQSSVETQIPSHDINRIGPSNHFNIPQASITDPEVKQYMQQLSHAVSHLKISSRLFSTNDLKGLDSVLNNIPPKVSDNQQANKAVNEIKQARSDMDSTFFGVNLKGANLDSKGFHTGDTKRFSFTPDGQTQIRIVGDIYRHLKEAKNLMKPFITGKVKGATVVVQGNSNPGKPATAVSGTPIPQKEGPIVLGKTATGPGANSQIDTTHINNPDAQKIIDQINGKLKTVQDELDKLREAHSNLTIENTDLKARLAEAQHQIDQLKTTQQLPDGLTQLENKKADLERQITDLQTQQTQAKEDLKRATDEKERVSREADSLGQQIPALQHRADSLKGAVGQLNTQKEKTQTEVTQLQTKKSDLEGDINHLNQEKGSLDNQLSDLKQKVTQAQGILNQANVKSQPTFNNIWSNFPWLQKLGIFLLTLTGIGIIIAGIIMWKKLKKFQDENDKVADLQNRVEAIEKNLNLKRENEDLEREVELKRKQNADLEAALSAQEAELKEATEKLAEVRSDYQQIQEDLTRTKEEKNRTVADLQTRADQLNTELTEKQARLTTLTSEVELAAATSRIPALQGEIANLTRELETLRQTAAGLNAEATDLQSDVEAKRNELSNLVTEDGTLRQGIENLEAQRTQLQSSLERTRQEFAIAEQRLSAIQEAISNQAVNEQTLSAQQNQLQEQETQRQKIQAEIDTLNQELEAKRQTLIEEQRNIEQVRGQVGALISQRDTTSQELEDLNARLAELKKQYDSYLRANEISEKYKESLEKDIADFETEKARLSSELGIIKKKEEVGPQVDELVKQAEALETETDRLEVDVTKPLDQCIPPDDFKAISERYKLPSDSLIKQLNYALGISELGQKIVGIYKGYPTVYDWFKEQDFYKDFKQRAEQLGLNPAFDHPGKAIDFEEAGKSYSLELSDRGPEYLIRGLFSGDCTNPYFAGSSFESATLRHLVMPSFFNFKVLRGKEWVGNIYAVVVKQGGKSVLIIDAMQIPWRQENESEQPYGGALPHQFPTKLYPVLSFNEASGISDGAIEGLKKYAQKMGFAGLWHSSFVSNFYTFKEHYNREYQNLQKSKFDSIDMMIGYDAMQRELHLGNIYIESNSHPPAWIVWQGKISQPQPTRAPTQVQRSPEEFIEAMGKGEYISPETRQILKEKFAILPSWLAGHLRQRMRESKDLRKVFEILGTGINISEWMKRNKRESGYAKFEKEIQQLGINPEFDKPGLQFQFEENQDNNSYRLVLSARDADDLVRGYISGDCTNPGWQHASATFSKYVPDHILKPGFLNFRVFRALEHGPYEWIGNVYAAVIRQKGKGILLIDAIQIPWQGIKQEFGMEILPLPSPYNGFNPKIPFSVKDLEEAQKLSDLIIEVLAKQYAPKYGFKGTYLGFGSNFTPLVEHFYNKYAGSYREILSPSETIQRGLGGAPAIALPRAIDPLSEREYFTKLKALNIELVGLDKDKLDSFPNSSYARRGFADMGSIDLHQNRGQQPVAGLPKAMIFDLDRTLSRTMQPVPLEILEQLKGFLKAKINIAVVSAQSLEEMKIYLINPLSDFLRASGDSLELLKNLYISPSEGSQLLQFYTDGQFKEVILDDSTTVPFDTDEHKKALIEIVRKALRDVINPLGNISVVGPVLLQDPGVTFIHNRDISLSLGIKEAISVDKRRELIERIKQNIPANWQIDILVSGGGTIHILSKGVEKSVAMGLFRNYIGQGIQPQQILIVGDDFGVSGLDRKLIIPGAKIYSVGAKNNLPAEVTYYGQGGDQGWQRTLHLLINKIKSDFAGSPKGKGMFTPDEHINVNAVISQAQREGRGELIWGNASGWPDNRAKYAQSIGWDISSLRKKYPSVKIPKLGKVDIADILSSSSIVLIIPRANAPPGLLVNNEHSYLIAHNGFAQNSIYIDHYTYNKLYPFEIAILLAHEAILLGSKKLAASKGIPWTEQLVRDILSAADEFEIQIVGRSDKGNSSRFDDRIVEILGFNQPKLIVEEPRTFKFRQERPKPYTPPSPQPKPQVKPPEDNGKFSLDFPDTKDNVIDGLRKLFLDSILKDTNNNLPAKWEAFPPPMAREIKNAYDLGKIKGIPLDPDLLAALTVFFSRLFPNHANSLINYLRNLNIYIMDNGRGPSTFGATLDGNTFYIQKSLFEDLLKKSMRVEEIIQRIKSRDRELLVALFRIIIHEIGAAFFKTSHESSQELEKLFLALLSRTTTILPYRTQEEFRNINSTVDLNSRPRLDWAINEPMVMDQGDIRLIGTDVIRSVLNLANKDVVNLLKGGIDLNQINIRRTGKAIQIQFDPAQLNAIEQDGFEGFTPVITNIIRIQSPLPLLGVTVSNDSRMFAKGPKAQKESVIL